MSKKGKDRWFFAGVAYIIGAIVFGLWAGIWWAFIGGIVLVIESAKADPVNAFGVAFGIARVIFTALIGWGAFAIGAMCSAFCLSKAE